MEGIVIDMGRLAVGMRVRLSDGRGAVVDALTGALVGLRIDGGGYVVLDWRGGEVAES